MYITFCCTFWLYFYISISVCDFKLQNKNAVKNHQLDHINESLPNDSDYSDDDKIENSEQGKTKTKADNIMDRFDQNGNPFFSDSNSESEIE